MPDFDPIAFGKTFTHRKASVRGTELHYVEGGRGAPVLLVAGWPQSWYAWRHVMPSLANDYHVIAVDPPGLGESGRSASYDTANIALYIDALVDALNLDSVDFIGHDIGAWIGYAYAARYTRRIRRLVLIDATIPGIAPADAYALTPERVSKTFRVLPRDFRFDRAESRDGSEKVIDSGARDRWRTVAGAADAAHGRACREKTAHRSGPPVARISCRRKRPRPLFTSCGISSKNRKGQH